MGVFATFREFYRNRKCQTHRYAHRKGSGCTADRDPDFGPANKMSQHDCPRCKSAEPSLMRWRQSAAPPCKAQLFAGSSGSLNFRFFSERRSKLNERDASIAELRAAIHAFDH